jgi:tRNA threonylcarbamoyladenosine biosynthesis protein TsaB
MLGVAVLDDNGQGAEFNYNLGLRHASHLVPTIKDVLKFAGLTLKDIDAYCVSIGPGSFTGLRIGVTTVKALALVDKKKVVAVPSLDVLARNAPQTTGRIIGVILDAKKEKAYACFYQYKNNELKRLSPYLLKSYKELAGDVRRYKAGLLLGDAAPQLTACSLKLTAKFANAESCHPRAINVARIGLGMLRAGKTVKDIDALAPFYMHAKDVQVREGRNR